MNKNMTTCKTCGKEIAKGVKKCPNCGKDQRSFFMKHKIISSIGIIIILCMIGKAFGGNGSSTSSDTKKEANTAAVSKNTKATTASNKAVAKPEAKPEVKQRQVQGKAIDLGAGTFTVGKDIPEGTYDVTPVDGQGNFTISNASSMDLDINEVLGVSDGMGVSKVRAKLVKDEQIKLEGINKTHFEPVTAQFVTDHKAVSLYSGRFIVGEDIGKGRYIVTPAGGSGNFIVTGSDGSGKSNEILGEDGVKQVTVDLDDGDIINISSLNQVNFAPAN